MKKILQYIKLIRVHQWVKNLFIFLPPFFALKIRDEHTWQQCLIAFIAFSLLASAVYIFNDALDVQSDRLHPTKRTRPLASKAVSIKEAVILLVGLLLVGAYLFIFVIKNTTADIIAGIYLVNNFLYTIKLKNISLLDIMIISVGFVLRILLGGAVTNTPLSIWIILMT